MDIAEANGVVFLLWLRVAERFSDLAMAAGSSCLKISFCKSRASLVRVTRADHFPVRLLRCRFGRGPGIALNKQMRLSLTLIPAHDRALANDMPLHRLLQIFFSRDCRQVDISIQSE